MLNSSLGDPRQSDRKKNALSVCHPSALSFEEVPRSGSSHLKKRSFVNGFTKKNNGKEKNLC